LLLGVYSLINRHVREILAVGLALLCHSCIPVVNSQDFNGRFYVDADLESRSCNTYNLVNRSCNQGAEFAFRSLLNAINNIQPGLEILIQPGNYNGGMEISSSGSEAQPIALKALGPGVIISGSGSSRDAIFINDADYIVIDGIEVTGAERAGLRISQSDHVTVRNSTFQGNGSWGVFTDFSNYTTIENSIASGSRTQHGIYISNSSDYPTIRNNRIFNNAAAGIHMNGDSSMGGDGVVSYGLIERNTIFENGRRGASAINLDGVTHTVIRNNLLYENHASGISLYQIDGGSDAHSNRVMHNTVVMANDGRWALNIQDTRNNKLFNNIALNNNPFRGSILVRNPVQEGFESDFNYLKDSFATDGEGSRRIYLDAWQSLGYDTNSSTGTGRRLFENYQQNNFRPLGNSPAIDRGSVLELIEDDLEGTPRPLGNGPDIGAFEIR